MQVYQSSRKERHLQGVRAGSQDGQGCPQAPRGTNRGTAPQGRGRHILWAELPKGLQHAPGGARSGSGGGSASRGLHGPGAWFQRHRPQIPGHQGKQPRIWHSPRDRRKPREHTAVRRLLLWVQPACGAPRPLRTGSCGNYCGSWLQGWRPGRRHCCSSYCHFLPGTQQGPHRINSSHWALHLAGGWAAPPGAHTSENQHCL